MAHFLFAGMTLAQLRAKAELFARNAKALDAAMSQHGCAHSTEKAQKQIEGFIAEILTTQEARHDR